MANANLTEEFIAKQLKDGIFQFCPSCNRLIEKAGGCNYIECKCNAKFCWNCKKIKGDQPNHCPYKNTICNSH